VQRSEDEKWWSLIQGSVDLLALVHRSVPEEESPDRERYARDLERIGRAANRLGWLLQQQSDPSAPPFGPEPAKRRRTNRRRAGKSSNTKKRSARASDNDEERFSAYLQFLSDFTATCSEVVSRHGGSVAQEQERSAAMAETIAADAARIITAIKAIDEGPAGDIVHALMPITDAGKTLGRALVVHPSLDTPLPPQVIAAALLMQRAEPAVFVFLQELAHGLDPAQAVEALRERLGGADGRR